MKNVLIIGAGGHAQVVADILFRMAISHNVRPIGFVDDDPTLHGRFHLNVPVLSTIANRHEIDYDLLAMGIGDNRTRYLLYRALISERESFVSAIHPQATIGSGVSVGKGCVVGANVVVNTGSVIEDNVVLNTSCIIEHHNHIEAHAHIGPGAKLGGSVTIGAGSLVGIGTTILPQRVVGSWSIVGAGTVVIRNVASQSTVVGVPGRVVNHQNDE